MTWSDAARAAALEMRRRKAIGIPWRIRPVVVENKLRPIGDYPHMKKLWPNVHSKGRAVRSRDGMVVGFVTRAWTMSRKVAASSSSKVTFHFHGLGGRFITRGSLSDMTKALLKKGRR